MTLSYKLTEDKTAIQMNDKSMPIYIDSENDDKEQGIDALHLLQKLPSLQNDLKTKRKEASDLKGISDTLEGLKFDISSVDNLKNEISSLKSISSVMEASEISDMAAYITKANEAFDTLSSLKGKDLKNAEEVEKIKKKAMDKIAKDLSGKYQVEKDEFLTNLKDRDKTILKNESDLYELFVSDKFNSSPFVKDKLARSSREARLLFSDNFKVELTENGDRKAIGYLDGEKINSLEQPGNYAGFEEALKIMVENDQDKESLLKGGGKSGTGSRNSSIGLVGIEALRADQTKALADGDFQKSIRLKREMADLQK